MKDKYGRDDFGKICAFLLELKTAADNSILSILGFWSWRTAPQLVLESNSNVISTLWENLTRKNRIQLLRS